MATNQFKPFATRPDANVTPQNEWENLPALLSGFASGKASSAQVNKALRQTSFIAAALAQFVSDKSGQDVLDDGDIAAFLAKLTSGFGNQYLSRQNPFADIKADGAGAVSTALANLGLGEGSALPVGVPVPWALSVAPAGWLKCNGAAFSAAQYPKLAQVYPALVLPDLRGEFIRGWDDGRGIDGNRGLLSFQEGTIISGFDDNDTGDISSIGSPAYGFGDTMTTVQWEKIKGKTWISNTTNSQRYEWWAYVSARPRNIAFNYIVRAA
ncbi:phage tail protein [Enterobacter sp. Ap-916]|uniref:tail fiber protein n=1 Tax=unclassified Enterobacter TaxID=2608935 RepID=UPI00141FB5C2|nr:MULTISPECIES: tail fiber protein [unclassified Enterobacter]NIF56757.1 phage tail protein [Enterobacter sp. Ap-867]NIG29302.1 phage tail protein [Enterobacter sp. Ap-916]